MGILLLKRFENKGKNEMYENLLKTLLMCFVQCNNNMIFVSHVFSSIRFMFKPLQSISFFGRAHEVTIFGREKMARFSLWEKI